MPSPVSSGGDSDSLHARHDSLVARPLIYVYPNAVVRPGASFWGLLGLERGTIEPAVAAAPGIGGSSRKDLMLC